MKRLNEAATTTKILERLILPFEKVSNEVVFDCRMCGQCILHSTGLTCPMRCPKNLRNGPCGGVRLMAYRQEAMIAEIVQRAGLFPRGPHAQQPEAIKLVGEVLV